MSNINHEDIVRKLSQKYKLPEYVIDGIIRSPFEFMRDNSVNFTSVRIPNFGIFMVKPNRLKHLNGKQVDKEDKD